MEKVSASKEVSAVKDVCYREVSLYLFSIFNTSDLESRNSLTRLFKGEKKKSEKEKEKNNLTTKLRQVIPSYQKLIHTSVNDILLGGFGKACKTHLNLNATFACLKIQIICLAIFH